MDPLEQRAYQNLTGIPDSDPGQGYAMGVNWQDARGAGFCLEALDHRTFTFWEPM